MNNTSTWKVIACLLVVIALVYTANVGAQQLYDPLSATYQATRPATQDSVSTPTVQEVNPGLLNAGGTIDRQKAAPGAQGVPSYNFEGTKNTYASVSVGFTPAATATDFYQLVGSGSKTVRIEQVKVCGVATGASVADVILIKRTTADSGGTQAQPALGQHDSADVAPTAVVNTYSVNPAGLGTGVSLRATKLNMGAAAGGPAGCETWNFGTFNEKGLVLRGTAQSMNLNWNGATVPSGTLLDVWVDWTEE